MVFNCSGIWVLSARRSYPWRGCLPISRGETFEAILTLRVSRWGVWTQASEGVC